MEDITFYEKKIYSTSLARLVIAVLLVYEGNKKAQLCLGIQF
jgi:hypothetical protein